MSNRYILITGGAGFIGTNVARSYLEKDQAVHILDNLGRDRCGAERQRVAEFLSWPCSIYAIGRSGPAASADCG